MFGIEAESLDERELRIVLQLITLQFIYTSSIVNTMALICDQIKEQKFHPFIKRIVR